MAVQYYKRVMTANPVICIKRRTAAGCSHKTITGCCQYAVSRVKEAF